MTLILHPDPEHPEGGFAFFELPQGTLTDQTVHVSIMDAYSKRWLTPSDPVGAPIQIGEPNWQPDQHSFGPYDVHNHDGADWVRVGPEIVNKLDEYVPLTITVAGRSYDVTWPDNLPPRAGAAGLGGLAPLRKDAPDPAPVLQPKPIEPDPQPDPAPPDPDPTPVAPVDEGTGKRRGFLFPLLLLLLVVLGGFIWWLWSDTAEQVAPKPDVADREPVIVADENPCTADSLRQLTDFKAIRAQMSDCGSAISPDLALGLLEDFAASDDAEALALFGVLYDSGQTDARIENLIGLTFDADPTRAAEYYARARDAGSQDATEFLNAVCVTLENANSTLARGAYDDFCK